jgi:hypothetical protein
MPQSIGAGNICNTSAVTSSKKSLMHAEELTGLSADLLGLAAICKEFRRPSSSAVEVSRAKSVVSCYQQTNANKAILFDACVRIPDISRGNLKGYELRSEWVVRVTCEGIGLGSRRFVRNSDAPPVEAPGCARLEFPLAR